MSKLMYLFTLFSSTALAGNTIQPGISDPTFVIYALKAIFTVLAVYYWYKYLTTDHARNQIIVDAVLPMLLSITVLFTRDILLALQLI